MKSSRRGFLGKLAALIAAPAIPAVLTPVEAIAQTSALTKLGADFDGNVDYGSYSRGQATEQGGHMSKIIVQPRYRHVVLDPIMVCAGMTALQASEIDSALNSILAKMHQPASNLELA